MRTDIEHLLTPRFEVIADYPHNPHDIGDIIKAPDGCTSIHQTTIKYTDEFGENVKQQNHCTPKSFESYPALFKPLQWWEKRTEDEMPMYLKIDNVKLKLSGPTFSYYKVLKWHMDIFFAQVEKDRMSGCSLPSFNQEYTYQPCSEEEYLNNVK